LLHLWPRRIPRWYVSRFPGDGIEFERPGLLSRLPIEGFPPRWREQDYTGPPGGDLETARGPVRPEDNPDPGRYPALHWRLDAEGYSNRSVLERADVILLGDSFGNAASVLSPPGLQASLEAVTGLAIYNLSVPGIGPQTQLWSLREYGLPKRPSAVIWMYFDGNDLLDANTISSARAAGYQTWADVPAKRERPNLLTPDILQVWLKRELAPSVETAWLPGLDFPLADGSALPVWFHPIQLIAMSRSAEWWQALGGYQAAEQAIRTARRECEQAGVRFLFLFVPCKSHILISRVERNADLVHRMATAWSNRVEESDPEAFLESVLRNRAVQEQLMRSFCEREGIEFLSASAYLEALAASGDPGYFSADTHWSPSGQRTLVEPLRRWLTAKDD